MFAHEWALMLFTLLSQLTIGTFLILTLTQTLLIKKTSAEVTGGLTRFGLLLVGPVMAVALALSLFHLGTPTNAVWVMSNLGSSWLSREILFGGLFLVCWFLSVYTTWDTKPNALTWLAAAAGLLAVFSMASIYASTIHEVWSNLNTHLVFFGTTLLFGTAGALSSIIYSARGKTLNNDTLAVLQKINWIGLAAIAIQLIYFPIFLSLLVSGGKDALASAEIIANAYAFPFILKWILSLCGGLLLFYALGKLSRNKQYPAQMIYLALLAILVGEFIGRYIFYAMAV